jgi:hypothetical protein
MEPGVSWNTKYLCLNPNGGRVGVATPSPGYAFDVNGAIHGTSHSDSSDLRFKEKVGPIKDALSKLIQITGVEFEWNEFIHQHRDGYKKDKKQLGFIAQEVEQYFPDIVERWELKDVEGKMVIDDARAINYGRMTPIIVEAIKEIVIRLEALEKK